MVFVAAMGLPMYADPLYEPEELAQSAPAQLLPSAMASGGSLDGRGGNATTFLTRSAEVPHAATLRDVAANPQGSETMSDVSSSWWPRFLWKRRSATA